MPDVTRGLPAAVGPVLLLIVLLLSGCGSEPQQGAVGTADGGSTRSSATPASPAVPVVPEFLNSSSIVVDGEAWPRPTTTECAWQYDDSLGVSLSNADGIQASASIRDGEAIDIGVYHPDGWHTGYGLAVSIHYREKMASLRTEGDRTFIVTGTNPKNVDGPPFEIGTAAYEVTFVCPSVPPKP